MMVIIIAVGFYGFGVLDSFSKFQDPAVEEVIRTELSMDLNSHLLQSLEQMRQSGDYSAVQENLEKLDTEAIQNLRINVSRPALSLEDRGRKTIYVRYQAPDSPEIQERYLSCNQVTINSWQFCTRSTAVSFYLEILSFLIWAPPLYPGMQ